jgi:hypothetical protein
MKTQSQYCTNIITFITVIAAAGLLSNAYAAKGSQRKALRRRLPYYGVYSSLGKKAGVNPSYTQEHQAENNAGQFSWVDATWGDRF